MRLNWRITLSIVVVLIVLQAVVLGVALQRDTIPLLFAAYSLELLFLFPLFLELKEEKRSVGLGLPIAISIWLLLVNAFGSFAHCVGGCSPGSFGSLFPLVALLLSLLIFSYAFKKTFPMYFLILLLCILLAVMFTPFMTNGRTFVPFLIN